MMAGQVYCAGKRVNGNWPKIVSSRLAIDMAQ